MIRILALIAFFINTASMAIAWLVGDWEVFGVCLVNFLIATIVLILKIK